uniref:Charged multivesicular body protein 4B n=1 Tax=Monodelphis domestica TaxID=13616 RepID=A0A5F8H1R5_MONDO
MSVFGKLFGAGGGKSGGKGGPTPQEAIQRLRDTEEMLSKKQEFLEKKIEQELASAKKHGTKNKRAALQALKRKKRYEKQLAQIDGTLSTIEFQREALENANTNTEVLKNMGYAAKAMKAAHDNMDIDKVDELMQDIADQQELAEEISTAISKPVGFGEEFDEDELMAELEELEQEELDKNLLEINGPETVPLPNVPSIALPSKPGVPKDVCSQRKFESELETNKMTLRTGPLKGFHQQFSSCFSLESSETELSYCKSQNICQEEGRGRG